MSFLMKLVIAFMLIVGTGVILNTRIFDDFILDHYREKMRQDSQPIHSINQYGPTLIDHFKDAGVAGIYTAVIFLIGILFAIIIHFKGYGLRHRIAFLLFAFLHFIIGLFCLFFALIHGVRDCLSDCVRPDAMAIAAHLQEGAKIVLFTTAESVILILIGIVLFLLDKPYPSKNLAEQAAASNRYQPPC